MPPQPHRKYKDVWVPTVRLNWDFPETKRVKQKGCFEFYGFSACHASSFISLHANHKHENITDKCVERHVMFQKKNHTMKCKGVAPAIKGARGTDMFQEGMNAADFSVKNVVVKHSSVCVATLSMVMIDT